jgi:purine-binding chemotaxis protein CheW
MATDKIKETAQYLTFKLGDELFAIYVFKAREVLDISTITRVPQAPAYMLGVVNVRGNAIPVVDLRVKFGLPKQENSINSRIIVIEIDMDGDTVILGGLADSVHEVIELEPNQIEEPPTIGMKWKADLILGMGRRDDQFIIILDIDRVFSSEELALALDPQREGK